MTSTYYPKPRLVERWSPKAKGPNTKCQKTLYCKAQRRSFLCYEPTVDGKNYCEACAKRSLTLTDRKPPSQVEPEQYHWTNDKPRKRA